MGSVFEQLLDQKIIPFATVRDPQNAVPLANALLEGGCAVVSVSMQVENAAESVNEITTAFPEMFVGAGSVTTVEQISAAHIAGASFALSLGFDPIVTDAAIAAGFPLIPGVMTPSNISRVLRRDCKVMNFFPAALGTQVLKAMLSAFRYADPKIVATGGINSENIAEWLAIPEVIAVGASWICPEELIEGRAWDAITERVRESLALVNSDN